MPELPEIAHLQGSLEPVLLGATVRRVRLVRPDIVRNGRPGRRPTRAGLLQGERIHRLDRHGKELAVIADSGRALCVHLGMSGQLGFRESRRRLPRYDHVHCIWSIETPSGPGRLFFRDPRRFGGIWCFGGPAELHEARWSRLGPDALGVRGRLLAERLARTGRRVKTALLDQRLVAGIGNIYVDEILFEARIDPRSRGNKLPASASRRLALATHRILERAIRSGGSTIRDYVDGAGRRGTYVQRHRVYGRASLPCLRCETRLRAIQLGQRTTVFCPRCQERFGRG